MRLTVLCLCVCLVYAENGTEDGDLEIVGSDNHFAFKTYDFPQEPSVYQSDSFEKNIDEKDPSDMNYPVKTVQRFQDENGNVRVVTSYSNRNDNPTPIYKEKNMVPLPLINAKVGPTISPRNFNKAVGNSQVSTETRNKPTVVQYSETQVKPRVPKKMEYSATKTLRFPNNDGELYTTEHESTASDGGATSYNHQTVYNTKSKKPTLRVAQSGKSIPASDTSHKVVNLPLQTAGTSHVSDIDDGFEEGGDYGHGYGGSYHGGGGGWQGGSSGWKGGGGGGGWKGGNSGWKGGGGGGWQGGGGGGWKGGGGGGGGWKGEGGGGGWKGEGGGGGWKGEGGGGGWKGEGGGWQGGGGGWQGGGGGGGGGWHGNEKGGSYSHGDQQEKGEKGGGGHKNKESYEKGHSEKHGHEENKGGSKQESGEKTGHVDEANQYAKGHHSSKGGSANEKGNAKGHKKGHKTKGFRTVHHKDEYKKDEVFYDEEHDAGHEKGQGHGETEHKHTKGGNTKKGHLESGYKDAHKGYKGDKEEGHSYANSKGHSGNDGHKAHEQHNAHYNKGAGHQQGEMHGGKGHY